MNKEMPYYIRRPTLFFSNKLVYPISRSNNTKIRIRANSAKFYVYQQTTAASEQYMPSFTGKARLHPGGFKPIYLNSLILRLSKEFSEGFKGNESGFSGLEVACWPLVPKFTGSNPVEAVGFFREEKSSARLPSEGK